MPDAFRMAREALVREIDSDVRALAGTLGVSELDPAVMQAIGSVPRECFVPNELQGRAYENRPLPIGHDQTISQPFIVAWMSHLLDLKPGDRVLDVGTGSGYQAAVLAAMGMQVFSIELEAALARAAGEALLRAGIEGVRLRVGDGHAGWPEAAPFAGIVVAAAAPEMPLPLRDQLAIGGRMVLPLERPGRRGGSWLARDIDQVLVTVRRESLTAFDQEQGLPVAFVPFRGA